MQKTTTSNFFSLSPFWFVAIVICVLFHVHLFGIFVFIFMNLLNLFMGFMGCTVEKYMIKATMMMEEII